MRNEEILRSANKIVLAKGITGYKEHIKVCIEDNLYNLNIDKADSVSYNKTINKISQLVNIYNHTVIN